MVMRAAITGGGALEKHPRRLLNPSGRHRGRPTSQNDRRLRKTWRRGGLRPDRSVGGYKLLALLRLPVPEGSRRLPAEAPERLGQASGNLRTRFGYEMAWIL